MKKVLLILVGLTLLCGCGEVKNDNNQPSDISSSEVSVESDISTLPSDVTNVESDEETEGALDGFGIYAGEHSLMLSSEKGDQTVSFSPPDRVHFSSYKGDNTSYSYVAKYELINDNFNSDGYSTIKIQDKEFYYKEIINSKKLSDILINNMYFPDIENNNYWKYIYRYNDELYARITVEIEKILFYDENGMYAEVDKDDEIDISKILLDEDVFNKIFNFEIQ